MVAVLTVFACHLWDWPRGGFTGVDVFFVISGFLITGNLLRSAEKSGNVSFSAFYWNRVRRIVPAATVVLTLTYLASVLVFLPFRAEQIGIDALAAFIFLANWHFAIHASDYFAAAGPASPIQHYWSLSIEEQFYFVWPALIFVIGVVIARKAWTHERRMLLAGSVMGVIVIASLSWAVHETATRSTWAYFDAFARVWELGVGALLATLVGVLARIPTAVKPVLSWAGLGLIATSLFLIADDSGGFPAPWALLPVTGAALVITAGVGGEPRYQAFLRNPVATYIGDFSYSLYLVHWPVIVILGAVVPADTYFSLAVVGLSFGLAIVSYHFVENPLRHFSWARTKEAGRDVVKRRYEVQPSTRLAAVGALSLLVTGFCAFAIRPDVYKQIALLPVVAVFPSVIDRSALKPELGPLTAALQGEIVAAVQATEWPRLAPTMEAVIHGIPAAPELWLCGLTPRPAAQTCTFGEATAPTKVVLVGDSIAMTYAGPLRQLALDSGGQLQVRIEAMYGCHLVDLVIANPGQPLVDGCPARKQHTLDVINTVKPDVVIVSNVYEELAVFGTGRKPTPGQRSDSIRQFVSNIEGSKVAFIAGPPIDKNVKECYSIRSSVPGDCVSRVLAQWRDMAVAEKDLADEMGAVWVDSRPWFCSPDERCPSFVGTTPVKFDPWHMTPPYAQKITPMIGEALKAAGVI